jgi:hypothetical protein
LAWGSPATLRLLLRAERTAEAKGDAPNKRIVKSVITAQTAKAELWRALQGGTSQATGINLNTGRRVPIPDFEWRDLECIEEQGRDIVCVRGASPRPPTRDPGRRAVDQLLGRGEGVAHAYTDVVVRRTETMANWPPSGTFRFCVR